MWRLYVGNSDSRNHTTRNSRINILLCNYGGSRDVQEMAIKFCQCFQFSKIFFSIFWFWHKNQLSENIQEVGLLNFTPPLLDNCLHEYVEYSTGLWSALKIVPSFSARCFTSTNNLWTFSSACYHQIDIFFCEQRLRRTVVSAISIITKWTYIWEVWWNLKKMNKIRFGFGFGIGSGGEFVSVDRHAFKCLFRPGARGGLTR